MAIAAEIPTERGESHESDRCDGERIHSSEGSVYPAAITCGIVSTTSCPSVLPQKDIQPYASLLRPHRQRLSRWLTRRHSDR